MPMVPHSADEWLLKQVLKFVGYPPIQLALKDGPSVCPPGPPPVATVVIKDHRTLAQMLRDPEVGFGEAYSDGRVQVKGDLVRLTEAIYEGERTAGWTWHWKLASKWMEFWQSNSVRGSRDNIHRHYDIGNDFYKLWLDPQLVYTCAYFPTPSTSLEQAQTAKLDYVCRKLRLQPGETVVEAGCGWGALALHMAREYGVNVRAYNISHEQIRFARERAQHEGLSHQVEFIEDDYRNATGKSDVFVSVGMLEHVGVNHYKELGQVVHRLIGESGRGFFHFIGRNQPGALSRWIRKRIFPGACPPTLRQTMDIFEGWDFSVLDVENLRLHYAKTLEHWLEQFEQSQKEIAGMYDQSFVRAWRLYLAGSAAAFRCGTLQLFQVLFSGPRADAISWTRSHLYNGEPLAIESEKWTTATS